MKTILPILVMLMTSGLFASEEPHSCDAAVAHNSDPDRVAPGVSSREVVVQVAIPACREAVAEYPDVARFHYQLGRALVYWADANNVDTTEGVKYVKQAAEMGHTQAIFVLGLMYQRENKVCDVERLFKQAADRGLKSARLTYVNEVLKGAFVACESAATKLIMQDYLLQAQQQVGGYYENMLLDNLTRQLDRLPAQ